MHVCWSIKRGVGTTTVAGGLAWAGRATSPGVVLADLGGDAPVLFGVEGDCGLGIADWLLADTALGSEALTRLCVPVAEGLSILPRGRGAIDHPQLARLLPALDQLSERVVVDAGPLGPALLSTAVRGRTSLLVTRACPVALAAVHASEAVPDAVVLVRARGRRTTAAEVSEAAGAPVVAELEMDPAVGAAADVGLAHRRLPRSFVRALGTVA